MAPAKVTTKAATKPAGKDIRAFFGSSSQSSSQPTPSLSQNESQRTEPQSSSLRLKKKATAADNLDAPKQNNISSSIPRKKPVALVISDSDDDQPVAPKKISPKRKKVSVSSDDEETQPKKRQVTDASSSKARSRPSTSKDKLSKPLPSSSSGSKNWPLPASDDEAPIRPSLKRKKPSALLSSDEDEPTTKKASTSAKVASVAKSRMSIKVQDPADSDSDELVSKKDPSKTKKSLTKGKGKQKEEVAEGRGVPPAKKPKFDWAAAKAAKLAGPSAPGSKEVPDGDPCALEGLSFVFTGELTSFSREEATDLAKKLGGRVVGQPSSRTDFVVLGDNAGPSKLQAIKKHEIKTLSEDEFLNLIATRKGSGEVDEKTKKKLAKEKEAIETAAKEMEKREKKVARESMAISSSIPVVDPSTQLWTTRYAPQNLKEVCGNKDKIEKLQDWLTDWSKSLQSGFKKPGKHGMNTHRCVLITGPPGIGKTTSAHLCAKLAGYTPIELNASDTRSKKLVESGMNINNKSLDSYIGGSKTTNSVGVTITDKCCLIMDEVDGMSAGDRGGIGALHAMIKKTKIPIICIANDKNAPKMKPLTQGGYCYNLPFSRPPAQSIRSRILSIAFKEKLKIPANVIDELITGSQSDIRQVLNMLSTWKLSNNTMDFDEGKTLTKMNQKYTIMSPFDITIKMLGPYLFGPTSRETLGEKMEFYFQDHAFVPLLMQENYLKGTPAKLRNETGPEREMAQLRLMDKAASSISDGDLVDSLIHGPEQHWSLMPLHAVCSTVKPASYVYGSGSGHGPNGIAFTQWLGQNSKQNKLSRQLNDIQIRMRLKVSGDRNEIRQSYLPALYPHIVQPLIDTGATAVEQVIGEMDNYYLSKDEWDTIVELGVGDRNGDKVLKGISAAVKTSFTRKYNTSEHPIPFHKMDIGKAPKKLAAGPAPDIEDAFEIDEVEDASADEKDGDDDDISKDSLIKASKKKKAANAPKEKAKPRAKAKK